VKLREILWPIKKKELGKFLPMALMLFFVLFNYNALRSFKDSLIVPNIGAEAISFVKLYFVVPSAILFTIIYAKLTSILPFQKIFYYISIFFLAFFLIFAFILYPNQELINPSSAKIQALINSSIDFGFFTISMDHFKWFLLIFGKWPFALFYIIAELWGSAMIFLMFWQFANQTTSTEEAKRFYPMFGLIGHIGPVVSGALVKYYSHGHTEFFGEGDQGLITIFMIFTSIALICTMGLFKYINTNVLTKVRYAGKANKSEGIRSKLPLLEGFKVIFSSKYLGYIVILIFCYGISINLVEGPWKAKIGELYPNTKDYAHFMGNVIQLSGACAMIFMILGANILRAYGWYVAAMMTPIMILVTGVGFFSFIVFDDNITTQLTIMIFDPLWIAVMLGTAQNVLSKATKYSLFDSTKEMTYIPADDEIKSKGKAAVDVVGARLAKSGGAFVQTLLFMLFPTATFTTIAPYLMIIFIIVLILWLLDLRILNRAYNSLLQAKKNENKY
jgi:AAA family ATP:ADP antiporter